jgi:hypothetical protein
VADEAIAALLRLHADVDARAHELRRRHADRLQCRIGCASCCIDDLSVFEVEADRIRAEADRVLREPPHPVGACAFLDAHGACRIYAQRPYVCRTQGLPLRWVAFDDPGAGTERRDICPLNGTEDALETFPSEACWELGPVEGRLAGIQAARDGNTLRRVLLRALFPAPR